MPDKNRLLTSIDDAQIALNANTPTSPIDAGYAALFAYDHTGVDLMSEKLAEAKSCAERDDMHGAAEALLVVIAAAAAHGAKIDRYKS